MKKFNKKIKGIALLQALMVTATVGVAAGFIMTQMRLTENTFLIPRIRSDMLIAESAFRNLAYMNETYTSPFGASSATVQSGVVNRFLQKFESNMTLLCPSPGTCGIRFIPDPTIPIIAPVVASDLFRYDPAIRTFSTTIIYQGSIVKVKPITIKIVVPDHILTGAPFRCAARGLNAAGYEGPFFRGYKLNGDPLCTGWGALQTNNGGQCPAGSILSGVNNQTMQLNCVALSAAAPGPSCAAGEYISNVNWATASAGSVTYSCAARPNPFTYFGYVTGIVTF